LSPGSERKDLLGKMAFWRLHYHLTWAAWGREPLIDAAREHAIHRAFFGKAKEIGLLVHGVGNVADHVHVVISIPPRIAVAETVRQLKGASSHAANQLGGDRFRWQQGYGALTIDERSLASIAAYARAQKQHHESNTTIEIYERWVGEDAETDPFP
jgi:putative transposase